MKLCTKWRVDEGKPAGIIDLSLVGDDHEFGISPDGTCIHLEGSIHPYGERNLGDAATEALTAIRSIAAVQRKSADDLRSAIAAARDAGVNWRLIGAALDIPHETAFRQYQAESPIVVVKARQSRPEAKHA